MKKLLIGAAVAALLIGVPGVALAQETGPNSSACVTARADLASAERALTDAKKDEGLQAQKDSLVAGLAELEAAVDAAVEADNALVPPATVDSDATVQAKTAVSARKALIADVESKIAAQPATLAAAEKAVTDAKAGIEAPCKEPVVETPTATPTPDPAPTTTVAPPPARNAPAAPSNDNIYNCQDFPLSDGRTAQNVLDANSLDPNNLDTDGDSIACEDVDVQYQDSFGQIQNVPSGGVETGSL